MNDILPPESSRWEALELELRRWLKSYGYSFVRTPILEQTRLFSRAIGQATDIVEKEMYSFEDSLNGEQLCLRPEATASTVRAAIEHNALHGGPQRLCYIGPMFRHERPQKGRYRQFHQVGVEALGFSGPDIDAELLLMCWRLWSDLGLKDIRLEINSLGSPGERLAHRQALVNYFESNLAHLDEDSHRRLKLNPLRILDSKNPAMQSLVKAAPRLMDFLGNESKAHFNSVLEVLDQSNVPFDVNHRLVRGLDYYNLTVFEWVTDKLGAQGTVCGGGRYDGLFEQLGGRPTPACGWAMGVERLLALTDLSSRAQDHLLDAYIVNQGDAARKFSFLVAEALRSVGLSVIQHCGTGNFKSQMKKADTSGAKVAVIIGDDEAAAGDAVIKPLRSGEPQFRKCLSELPEAVSKYLDQTDNKVAA